MMKKLLVIEAHSDDSAIGAYGYIKKLQAAGHEAWFMAAAMSDLNLNHCGKVSRRQRESEYADYVSFIGGKLVENFSPFDAESKLDTVPRAALVRAFEIAIQSVRPDMLICQAPSFHHDHAIVYESVIAALRPTMKFQPSEVLLMENPTYVLSAGATTDFKPNIYCILNEKEMAEKLDCFINCFPSQLRGRENCLSPDGIKTWAKFRALACQSTLYAEAFMTFIRRIR